MSDTDQEIVRCIDRFRQELATVIVQAIRQQVDGVLEKHTLQRRAREEKVLLRLERAAERRAKAAQDRAEARSSLEFKFRRRGGELNADLSALGEPSGRGSRRRRKDPSALLAEGGLAEGGRADGRLAGGSSDLDQKEAAPVKPPPLFVHKRTRDGQIQNLTRSPDEELQAAAAV